MRKTSNTDTICAIATPPGTGGIGVIRIFGPHAFEILSRVWRSGSGEARDRELVLGTALTPEGMHLDRAMAVRMPGPRTYTGEDVAEISAHGSPVVLKRILASCTMAGARLAGPGEFTRRAFLAGKIDLAQAEAVADLIHAESERSVILAQEQLEGRLSREVGALQSHLTELRAQVEAAIDFPEEGIADDRAGVLAGLGAMIDGVTRLRSTAVIGRRIAEGVRVAIVGRPNAGKSSLLNALAGRERAIVHHEPGTTRDVVEECVEIKGIAFRLRDTAGLRETSSEVESIGVARAHEELARADLLLALFDRSAPLETEDDAVLGLVREREWIPVITKCDLPEAWDASTLANRCHCEELCSEAIPWHRFFQQPVEVSAISETGIDQLTERMAQWAEAGGGNAEGATVTSARHAEALALAQTALEEARALLHDDAAAEFVAQKLRTAQDVLGAITGEVTTEALLDRIFARFCIGK
jgi:tRNA modification GTPase